MTIKTINPRGEPSNAGPVSSVMTPLSARMKVNTSEGRRLISPVRSTYRRIEMRVSNSHRSSHGCGLVLSIVSVMSCSGSNGQLRKRSVQYSIRRTNAIFKTSLLLCYAVNWPQRDQGSSASTLPHKRISHSVEDGNDDDLRIAHDEEDLVRKSPSQGATYIFVENWVPEWVSPD